MTTRTEAAPTSETLTAIRAMVHDMWAADGCPRTMRVECVADCLGAYGLDPDDASTVRIAADAIRACAEPRY